MKKVIFKLSAILLSAIFVVVAFALSPQKALAKDSEGNIVIVVDAGHGSIDGGAYQNGVKESEVNWKLALALKAELQTYWGVEVYLTRGSGEWHSNTGRGRLGTAVNADFAVSLHNNSSTNASVSGIEVYGTLNPSYSATTSEIGNAICNNVSALGLVNRGYKTRTSGSNANRDFYTFIDEGVRAGIPAMIIEHAFLSNPSDAAFIANAENQQKVSTATAKAIASYFGLEKRGISNGQSMTLTRTYSATFMTSLAGTFTSANEAVAKVNANGIITAVGAGTTTISCTTADGATESVTITVPEVTLVAVSAGISPTFYDPTETVNNANIIVKAIYSDGSVTQVKNYTLGETPYSANGIYDIPITYNGVTGYLRVYKTGSLGSYTGGAAYTAGANADILTLPQVYQGINTGINVVTTPKYSTYVGAAPELFGIPNSPSTEAGGSVAEPTPTPPTTEAPTPAPTDPPTEAPTDPPAEPPTEAPTEEITEEVTEDATVEPDSEEPTELVTEEATTKLTDSNTETTTKPLTEDETQAQANKYKTWIYILLGVVVVLSGATAVVVAISVKKK